MQKFAFLVLGLVILLFATAGSGTAHAALSPFYNGGQDACPNATTADECFWAPMPTTLGSYAQCTALKSKSQACVISTKDGTRQVCAWVEYSANCNCDAITKVASGSCTFMR